MSPKGMAVFTPIRAPVVIRNHAWLFRRPIQFRTKKVRILAGTSMAP